MNCFGKHCSKIGSPVVLAIPSNRSGDNTTRPHLNSRSDTCPISFYGSGCTLDTRCGRDRLSVRAVCRFQNRRNCQNSFSSMFINWGVVFARNRCNTVTVVTWCYSVTVVTRACYFVRESALPSCEIYLTPRRCADNFCILRQDRVNI